jgi:hypothetical protein
MGNSEKAAALYKEFPGKYPIIAIARNNTASYLLKYFPELTDDLRKQIEYNIGEALNASVHTTKPQSIRQEDLVCSLILQHGIMIWIKPRDIFCKRKQYY